MSQFNAATATPEEAIAHGMTIAVNASRNPNGPAIISPNGDRTWAELNHRVNQVARLFRERGLKTGDAVALLAHNAPEFVEAWAACQRAGLRITAVNWHQSNEIVAYVVDNCDAKALVASGRFVAGATEAAKLSDKLTVKLAFAGAIEGFDNYEKALAGQPDENITDGKPGTTMLYTSGTTGRPKGVYRKTPAVSQLTAKVNETARWNALEDVALVTGPLYHAAPLGINMVIPINAGVTVLLQDKWDAEDTLRLIQKYKATHTHVVPTMMHRMLQLPEETRKKYDVSSMRWIMHGAAPCPAHV
jgi:long-chain acyl-CoA synthetase